MKGKIKVDTGQILPVIKKWLYSEKEIFLRELVSNSFDAILKLKKIALTEEIRDGNEEEYAIKLTLDREKKTLTVVDNGLGMTKDEIEKYLAQIACSGAFDFVKEYEKTKDKDKSGIIGNFGLGFYSVFMVADLVEVESFSYDTQNERSVHWSCDGGAEYEINEGSSTKRGTKVTLHLNEDHKEYLEKAKIDSLIRKYVDFLPVNIYVDGAQANRKNPLWAKPPSQAKAEDYLEFYKYLYPHQGDPLFYIHLNVDYPFALQGILYFPRLGHEMELNQNNVRIYCKQVFVSDQAQEIIPKYLAVLQGVIDIPNLPLNVSRSYLQSEPQIKKISMHIAKKVADRLKEEFIKNRKNYSEMWRELAPFVKYAILNDENFYEQVKDAIIFNLVGDENTFVTLNEYIDANKSLANEKIYYAANAKTHLEQIQMLQDSGIQVVLLDTLIDNHFIQFMEYKNSDVKFVRVDAEISDHILDKEKASTIINPKDKGNEEKIIQLFQKALGNKKINIQVEAFKDNKRPAMILLPEQMRRLQEMSSLMAAKNSNQEENQISIMEHTLVLNSKNSIIEYLSRSEILHSEVDEKKEDIARHVYYLARLGQGNLNQSEIKELINSSHNILEKLTP